MWIEGGGAAQQGGCVVQAEWQPISDAEYMGVFSRRMWHHWIVGSELQGPFHSGVYWTWWIVILLNSLLHCSLLITRRLQSWAADRGCNWRKTEELIKQLCLSQLAQSQPSVEGCLYQQHGAWVRKPQLTSSSTTHQLCDPRRVLHFSRFSHHTLQAWNQGFLFVSVLLCIVCGRSDF